MQTPSATDGTSDPTAREESMAARVVARIRRLNRWLHFVAGFVLLGLVSLTVVNIVGRAFFDAPLAGAVELTEMAMILVVYLGFGHAEHEGDHISVDLLYEKLGRGQQLGLTVFNGLLGLVVIGVLAWQLYEYSRVLDAGGYVTSILRLPQGPVAVIGAAGTVLLVLALASSAVLGIRAFRRERG